MKRVRSVFIIIIFLFSIFSLTAQTIITHGQDVSGTWNPTGSPYIVQGLATVPEGEELIIEPGVEVRFASSIDTVNAFTYDSLSMDVGALFVYGRINAEGTQSEPITFSAQSDGYWGTLACIYTDGLNTFSYCEFSDMNRITDLSIPNSTQTYLAGLSAYEGDLNVSYSSFSNCYQLTVHSLDSNVEFHDNYCMGYIDNPRGGLTFAGFNLLDKVADIYNNEIIGFDSGAMVYRIDARVYNNISHNCNKGLEINEISIESEVYNNLIYDCIIGGMYVVTNSQAYAYNNTIVNNIGAGIHLEEDGNITVRNTILHGNGTNISFNSVGDSCNIAYSCFDPPIYHNQIVDMGNNIHENPEFLDASNNDFHLKYYSSCINRGTEQLTPYSLPVTDYDGEARVSGSSVDMGCYEVPISGESTIVTDGEEVSGYWTPVYSPYYIEGEAIVPAGQHLMIQPGVEILFHAGDQVDYSSDCNVGFLRVEGTINALGTEEDSIVFTRNGDNGYWGTVFIDSETDSNFFDYCKFEYTNRVDNITASETAHGVTYYNCSGYVDNSSFNNSNDYAYRGINSSAFIRDSYFRDVNNGSIFSGVGYPYIYNNRFFNNAFITGCTAITLEDGVDGLINRMQVSNFDICVQISNCHPMIFNSLFVDNNYGFIITGSSNPNIINNTMAFNQTAVSSSPECNTTIYNTIFWENNSSFSGSSINLGNSFLSPYNIPGWVNDLGSNITGEEPFYDIENGDYTLDENAACIDSGTEELGGIELPAGDLLGFPRIYGGVIDIGAYEYWGFTEGTYIDDGGEVEGIWVVEDSPYIMKGEVVIPAGSSLRIQAGVVVMFANAEYTDENSPHYSFDYTPGRMRVGLMRVEGSLFIEGQDNNPVLFTRLGDQGYWGSIVVGEEGNCTARNSTFEFMNCITLNNSETREVDTWRGFSTIGGASHITKCKFIDNNDICINSYNSNTSIYYNEIYAKPDKDAIVITRDGDLRLHYSINNNQIHSGRRGVLSNNTPSYIYLNTISGCKTGIEILGATSEISNNLIYDNEEYGIKVESTDSTFINSNTIVSNQIAGICFDNSANADITNTLLSDNAEDVKIVDGNSNITLSNCCLDNPSLSGQVITKNSNIFDDPLFTNTSNENFTLQASSPCINAGTDDFKGELNIVYGLDGASRILYDAIDIGCYEYNRCPWYVSNSDTTEIEHMYLSGNGIFRSQQVNSDYYVGVFRADGDMRCIGYGDFNDDGEFSIILESDSSDHLIKFRLWDTNLGLEHYSNLPRRYIPGDSLGNIGLDFDIYHQLFDLSPGWNWISLNIEPLESDIFTILSPIEEELNQIKNQTHSLTKIDGVLTGDLEGFEKGKMYMINVSDNVVLDILGKNIPASSPIALSKGCNWSAYYPNIQMEPELAFNSLEDNIDKIQFEDDVYYFGDAGSNSIELMRADYGYKLFLEQEDMLIYPSAIDQKNGLLSTILVGNQNNMVIYGRVQDASSGLVQVFDIDGVLHGESDIDENGFYYITIIGDQKEELSLYASRYPEHVWKIDFEPDKTIGFYSIDPVRFHKLPQAPFAMYNYPNPFNPLTAINFFIHEESATNLSIYNIKGQKVTTLIEDELDAGVHSIKWDGANCASGVYFIRLRTDSKTEIKKIILLK